MPAQILMMGLAIVAAGCGPALRTTSERSSGEVLDGYERFAWAMPQNGTGSAFAGHAVVAEVIRQGVADHLTSKGYRAVRAAPDVYVLYHLSIEQRLTPAFTAGHGPRRPTRPSRMTVYEEVTLTVDLYDAATADRLWRGTATMGVGETGRLRQQMQAAVQAALADLPRISPPPSNS